MSAGGANVCSSLFLSFTFEWPFLIEHGQQCLQLLQQVRRRFELIRRRQNHLQLAANQ